MDSKKKNFDCDCKPTAVFYCKKCGNFYIKNDIGFEEILIKVDNLTK